jgi:hypothetical protein
LKIKIATFYKEKLFKYKLDSDKIQKKLRASTSGEVRRGEEKENICVEVWYWWGF